MLQYNQVKKIHK